MICFRVVLSLGRSADCKQGVQLVLSTIIRFFFLWLSQNIYNLSFLFRTRLLERRSHSFNLKSAKTNYLNSAMGYVLLLLKISRKKVPKRCEQIFSAFVKLCAPMSFGEEQISVCFSVGPGLYVIVHFWTRMCAQSKVMMNEIVVLRAVE